MIVTATSRSIVLLATTWICLAPALGQENSPGAAKQAIRRVLDAQVAAWNKGDLTTFMKGYWESPQLTFYSGKNVVQGWQATLDRYRKKYQDGGQSMGKLTFSELDIRPLDRKHAVVLGRWELVLPKETVNGLFTLIFEELEPGWRIVHDHTSS